MSHRILTALAAAAALAAPLAAASAVHAQNQPAPAPQVSVAIGPAFAVKAQRILIGRRDLDELRGDLAKAVRAAAARGRGAAPVRLDLVIDDAVPNRPTFDQLGFQTGLSLTSIGLGGAAVSGAATLADGSVRPVSFRWYETELRNEFGPATWSDADRAFDLFAGRVARGDLTPYAVGSTSRNAGDFTSRFGND